MTAVPEWWQKYAAEYPEWVAWVGGRTGLFHARLPFSEVVVRAQNASELAAEVRRAERMLHRS